MDNVNYNIGITKFDEYDKSIIEEYIKTSSSDKERYNKIYNEVLGNVESVLRELYCEVSFSVRLGYLKRYVWNWNMKMTDKDCLVAIFLNHYPAFNITEKMNIPVKGSPKHVVISNFCYNHR